MLLLIRAVGVAIVASTAVAVASPRSDLPVVAANDNRVPAGVLKNDTLRIDLVVAMARWFPEADSGPYVDVATFAEVGRTPQIPAPLIRVTAGTTIVASIRNDLPDSVLWTRGFAPLGRADSIPVKPGETRTFVFAAGQPGTYLYAATPGRIQRAERMHEREQLSGAFVVDSVGAKPNDRVFVINVWGDRIDSLHYRNALAINGKSWPHTERITATTGDSIRWRIINGSARRHPMHLHGFYYRVDSRGGIGRDTTYSPDARRLVVTEDMQAETTMSMMWSPDRAGNWLFHCHLAFHVLSGARLDGTNDEHAAHGADLMSHMAGLVIGMNVKPRNGKTEVTTEWSGRVRKLHLFAGERPRKGRSPLAMSYVLQRDDRAPAVDSVEIPGQPLILTRGEPTEITVVNRIHDATSVHWHGIELESYSDGVPGWSGMDKNLAPLIAPRDSFTARLTLQRSGTFIYHPHLNDVEQLTSGMYGPIIVLEPGERFDSSRDHIFTIGWDGRPPPAQVVINGDSTLSPLTIESWKLHRLRFVNIAPAGLAIIRLRRDSTAAVWTPRAKDGADLPLASRKPGPAVRTLNVGETFDAEFNPSPGDYVLSFASPPAMKVRTVLLKVR